MNDEIEERVAIALHDHDARHNRRFRRWQDAPADVQRFYREQARVAITAYEGSANERHP